MLSRYLHGSNILGVPELLDMAPCPTGIACHGIRVASAELVELDQELVVNLLD